jgi:hypothetical protein
VTGSHRGRRRREHPGRTRESRHGDPAEEQGRAGEERGQATKAAAVLHGDDYRTTVSDVMLASTITCPHFGFREEQQA